MITLSDFAAIPRRRAFYVVLGAGLAGAAVAAEAHFSWLQAYLLGRATRDAHFTISPQEVEPVRLQRVGPYDLRLGYVRLPAIVDTLEARGFRCISQSDPSPSLRRYLAEGLYPIPFEKSQAGLRIVDRDDSAIFEARHPRRVYHTFEEIPPVLVTSLLYAENRELLSGGPATRNPAVEWDRLAKASLEMLLDKIGLQRDVPGGSTLAVQLDKLRHSPDGVTLSAGEKLRQLASASLRAYSTGTDTREHRKQIVLDYLNSIPLAATRGFGEVYGLGDGLWAWYGAEFDELNRLLDAASRDSTAVTEETGLAFRQAVSLILAQSRPTYFLIEDPGALDRRVRFYIRRLGQADMIPDALVRVAVGTEIAPRSAAPPEPRVSFVERKAANSIRSRLVELLDMPSLYDLDRLDLDVWTTLDGKMQNEVERLLQRLDDADSVRALGLVGPRLLQATSPEDLVYSFTLYERGPDANRLLIRTDTSNQPLDISEDIKLELGSTAKLRTLVNYLHVVAELHGLLGRLTSHQRDSILTTKPDPLTRWAIDYLERRPRAAPVVLTDEFPERERRSAELTAMLEAAMDRRYSASPFERFLTGGGVHTFSNFDPEDDGQVLTVRQAFERSVNLVFIRLMRDVVEYYRRQVPGSTHRILENADEPLRRVYLERFADREGRFFLRRFYRDHKGQSPEEALLDLCDARGVTLRRLVVVYRSVKPQATVEELARFLSLRMGSDVDAQDLQSAYEGYGPDRWGLNDRAFLARVHPLELWFVAYLQTNPNPTWAQVDEASTAVRQEVYEWLFKTRRKNSQDVRIRSLLEIEAFLEIHRFWKRLGFPFESLVPSYATAIGSSGDTPDALAQLVGILLNGGVRKPAVRIDRMRFGKDTPFEVTLDREAGTAEQVLAPEVAAVALDAMQGVVDHGTARRLHNATDWDFDAYPIAGKTGTGDNQRNYYDSRGRQIASTVTSRTSVFAFALGDRYFGVVMAYASGPQAGRFSFTSALTVEVLRLLLPALSSLYEIELEA